MNVSRAAVNEVIALFERASEVNFCAAGRVGNVLEINSAIADDVMLTGDLHGHFKNFERILQIANLAKYPRRHLVLQEVCHGGPEYPDGGCQSHRMLEAVAKLVVDFPERVHFLMGNHELAELSDFPIQKAQRILNLLFRLGIQNCYGDDADEVREAYFPFLRSCPIAIRIEKGILVSHSIPEMTDVRGFDATVFDRMLSPDEYFDRGPLFDLVWGRDYRPENAHAFAHCVNASVLINGHEPCEAGFLAPNEHQVILDCCGDVGAYAILPLDGRTWRQADVLHHVRLLSSG